jgi:hypothetical protein
MAVPGILLKVFRDGSFEVGVCSRHSRYWTIYEVSFFSATKLLSNLPAYLEPDDMATLQSGVDASCRFSPDEIFIKISASDRIGFPESLQRP